MISGVKLELNMMMMMQLSKLLKLLSLKSVSDRSKPFLCCWMGYVNERQKLEKVRTCSDWKREEVVEASKRMDWGVERQPVPVRLEQAQGRAEEETADWPGEIW